MEKLTFVRRYEFSPIEGGTPYLAGADMYSDGESLYAFFVFHNPGKKKFKKASARITVYDVDKKPQQAFVVNLDIHGLRPGTTYSFPEPFPLPIESDGFNFEFLSFDDALAPTAVDVKEGEKVEDKTTEEEAKPKKTFALHRRALPPFFLAIGGAIVVGLSVLGGALSHAPSDPRVTPPEQWRPGAVVHYDNLQMRLYSDYTAAVEHIENDGSSFLSIPKTVNDYRITTIGQKAVAGGDYEYIDAPFIAHVEENAFSDCYRLKELYIGTALPAEEPLGFLTSAIASTPELRYLELGGSAYVYDDIYQRGVGNRDDLAITCTGEVAQCSWRCFDQPFSFEGTISSDATPEMVTFAGSFVSRCELRLGRPNVMADMFRNCEVLERVSISYMGDRSYAIAERAFEYSGLPEYSFDRVSAISTSAFANCPNLGYANIPSTCSYIGSEAFAFCPNLLNVDLHSPTVYQEDSFPSWTNVYYDGVLQEKGQGEETTLLYEYNETYGGYAVSGYQGSGWGSIEIPDWYDGMPVVAINEYALSGVAATEVYGGPNISYIGSYAFRDASSLRDIRFESENIEVASNAFSGAQALANFENQGSLYLRGVPVNNGTSNLRIHAGNMMQAAHANVFTYRNTFYDLETGFISASDQLQILLGSAVRHLTVWDYGFTTVEPCPKASNLEELELHSSQKFAIEDDAFSAALKLNYFDFEDVREIGYGAFRYCAFVNIDFPDSLVAIGEYAFRDCQNLEYVTVPAGLSIPETAFPSRTVINRR